MRSSLLNLTFALGATVMAVLLTAAPVMAHASIEHPHHWLFDNLVAVAVLLGGVVAGCAYWLRGRSSPKR